MKYTSFKTLALILSVSALLALSGCGSSGTPSDTELAGVNLPPVANAGLDQNVSIGDTVTLDGSASSDPDLDTLTYSWSLISEPLESTATLSDPTAINPTFVADRNGSYILELIVNDGTVDSDVDTVMINAIVISPLKTGQTTSYAANDDGSYQKGISPNFSRDNDTEIVTDHITGLMWQDDANASAESARKVWLTKENFDACFADDTLPACYDTSGDTAATYCIDLALGGFTDWRLPSRSELANIVNYGNALPSVDSTVFQNTSSFWYWSSTTYEARKYGAWTVIFSEGVVNGQQKQNSYNVRCVRDGQ